MLWLNRVRARIQSLFRRRRVEADLSRELEAFESMLVDRHLEQGLSLEEARRRARLDLDGLEQVKEQVRDVRMGTTLESLFQDLRFASRTLLRSPGFTAVAILTLALGIGVNTAIFSVVYAVLLRPLPYDHPRELALIWSRLEKTALSRAPASGPIWSEILHRNNLLADVAGIWIGNGTFTGNANPEQVKLAFVTPNFPALLGFRPELGRVFLPAEESFGGRSAIMLSHGVWQRRYGGDPAIIGKTVSISGDSATVVGILPPDFRLYFSDNVPAEVGAMVPFGDDLSKRPADLYFLRLLARLKPNVTPENAQADLDQVAAQIRGLYTELNAENLGFDLTPLQRDAVREVRPALIALFSGAGFVLLISCLNVANLLLARACGRSREIAVRSALGASRSRILRQVLLEGLVLCTVAGAAGVLLGWAGVRALMSIRPDYLARMPEVGLNFPVLAFVAALSFAAVLLCALAPSLESSKTDLNIAFREAGRTSQASLRRGTRAILIVGEISLGLVLLIGAGLMIRTLQNIQAVQPGFEAQHLLTFEIDLSAYRRPARINFVQEWESKLASLPGVTSVGAVSHLPLDDYPNWYSPYRPEGLTQNQASGLLADHRAITPGYLRAMGAKLLEGRFFDAQDRADGRSVVLVDDLLAHSVWPGESAIGKKLEVEHVTNRGFVPLWSEVVGVVEHIRNHSLSKKLRGEIYIPYEQSSREHLSFAVRTRLDPLALAGTIRAELLRRDRNMALSKVRPMTAYIQRATAPARFIAVLAGAFAGLALLLAAIGIYGVVSYSVSRRMHEMGVRMALGATSAEVLHLVMREAMGLASVGILLGTAAAFFVSRTLRSLIYGISAIDPATYLLAIAVIAVAAFLGCWRPAAQAASANPVDALRTP
jgi:putative ABC transport system permease protein